MPYRISPGISEDELSDWLAAAAKEFGKFDDGRVNYKQADRAPIVMCTVIYDNKILLMKRSYGLADAEGYWSVVCGFIDEDRPVSEIAAKELEEELGLSIHSSSIKVGKSYTLQNEEEKHAYIVFPGLVALNQKPNIVLDHEHTEYAWVKQEDIKQYHIMDDLN